MKPYGVISDVHLHEWSSFSTVLPNGVNSRLQQILDEVGVAAFDTISNGGDTLFITGDLFHVRGSVSPKVLNPVKELFAALTAAGTLKIVILTGNHDLESRNSEKLSNACETLSTIPGVTIVSEPRLFFDDLVVMVPWYDKIEDVRSHIKAAIDEIEDLGDDASNWTLMLHAPVNGVLIGIPDHGFYSKELAMFGFKRVFSGHYHNFKAFEGEVYSVGATTHQTWNDVGTKAGHLIVSDAEVKFVESSAPKFIDYDLMWDDDQAAEAVKGNFVRVRLGEADDEEIDMIRSHVLGLGGSGVNVNAIPVPKGTATTRTTATVKAPTVRESTSEWIKANSPAKLQEEVDKLAQDILTEIASVAVA